MIAFLLFVAAFGGLMGGDIIKAGAGQLLLAYSVMCGFGVLNASPLPRLLQESNAPKKSNKPTYQSDVRN